MSTDNTMPTDPVASEGPAGGSNWSHVQERRKQQIPMFNDLPINILIVDDEPKNLTVLETVLDDPGYRLVRAESADHALRALVVEEFALLILDIRMPGMTGIELAQMIKERKKTARIPIIFLTAYYNEDQHVLEGYRIGAVDFLLKPVNPAILRSKVAVFAELHRANRDYTIANRALLAEVAERRRIQEQLRELNETLEQRVSERTQALEKTSLALNESGERYRSLFEGSLDAIISLDKDGRFEAANPAVLRLSGRSLEELKNLTFMDICAPDQREAAMAAFRAAFTQECVTIDTAIIGADGERRELLISATPMVSGGQQVSISCIGRDITDRKRAEIQLNIALAAAEKANQAKSAFISSMSHELRTPLNAILGFAQLLEAGVPPPTAKQSEKLSQIIKAGWYLLELINGILDLAVIESGKLTLSREPVLLNDVMQECKGIISPQAAKRDIQIIFGATDPNWFVYADRTRLKQVILNLLSNAVKYNREQGTVEVRCSISRPNYFRISIKDSGLGLGLDELKQLFQPFNRLGQESGTEEGTGIGLMVSKQLVELMGGAIGVESTVDVGSEFWLELQGDAISEAPSHFPAGGTLAITEPGADENALADPLVNGLAAHTLLYVEDNPANMTLVQQVMHEYPQVNMLAATTGNRGIELARTRMPDVILMDINLPDINGVEALRILREGVTTQHIPIVALSANALAQDIEAGLAAGFFRYLTKPIKVDELITALDDAIKTSRNN